MDSNRIQLDLEPPGLLYKYVPPSSLKHVLCNRTLRLTPPDQFNDPLDCAPIFAPPTDTDFLDKKWEQYVRYEYDCISHESKPPFASFREHKMHSKQAVLSAWCKPLEESDADYGQRLVASWSKAMGIVCLSEGCDSMLMWSHYAINHTGFTIGFDSKANFLNRVPAGGVFGCFGRPQRVIYSMDRPISIPPGLADPETERLATVAALLTKSRDWCYESEWRVILPLSWGEKSTDGGITTVQFSPHDVRSIVMGYRIDPMLKKKIVSLTSKTFTNAQLYEAKPSPKSFKMVIGQFSVC